MQNAELLPKAGIFAFILLLFVTACAIYMNSELGIAPYDAVPKIISDRFVKLPFFVVRIIFDYSAITIGLVAACFAKNNIPNPVATFAGVGLRTNIFGSVCMGLLLGPAISLVGKFMKKIIPVFREN